MSYDSTPSRGHPSPDLESMDFVTRYVERWERRNPGRAFIEELPGINLGIFRVYLESKGITGKASRKSMAYWQAEYILRHQTTAKRFREYLRDHGAE